MVKLNGWQRLVVVAVGGWILSVTVLTAYEYASSKDGTFTGLVMPLQSVTPGIREIAPDDKAVESKSTGGAHARAIGQGREPEIPTERIIHWRMLLGAISFPFAVLLAVSLLSKVLSWISLGFENKP
jgi:hypothetical protein